jgi:hypothetical protein
MNSTTLIAIGALAFLMMGGKKKPRVVHGTVTPLDDELMQVVPGKAPFRPKSLESELADQDAPPAAAPLERTSSSSAPRSSSSSSSAPANAIDELFAATAAQAAQMPPPAVRTAPTQKEATPISTPMVPAPTAPAAAPARPMGPMVDVDVPINRVSSSSNATTNNVSPVLQPKSQGPQIPAGYDPAKAKAGASAIASHLAKKGPAGYSHPQLAIWQKQAALAPDGIYGGSTRGALIAYGVANPPRPFFKPVATIPYVPPEQRT